MSDFDFSKLPIIEEEQLINKPINEKGVISQSIFGPIKTGVCGCGIPFLKSSTSLRCPKCNVENVSCNERITRYARIIPPLPILSLVEQQQMITDLKIKEWYAAPYKKGGYLHYNIADGYTIDSCLDGAFIPVKLTGLYSLWLIGSIIEFIFEDDAITKYFGNSLLVTPPNTRPSIIGGLGNRVTFMSELDSAYNKVLNKSKYINARLYDIDTARYILLILSAWFNFEFDDLDLDDIYTSVQDIAKFMLYEDGHIVISQDMLNEHKDILGNSNDNIKVIALTSLMMVKRFFKYGGAIDNSSIDVSFIEMMNGYIDDEMKVANNYQKSLQNEVLAVFTCITTLLKGKEGLVRNQFIGRTIDFSARSVITSNPFIKPYEVKIPRLMFIKLYYIEYLEFVFHNKPESEREELTLFNIERLIRNSELEKKEYYVTRFINYFFSEDSKYDDLDKIVLINRQPTLWRYGIPAIKISGISSGDSIELNPLVLDPLNGDFDGDTVAIYRIHDYKARVELYEDAYILNTPKFDHNSDFLHTLKDESFYMYNLYMSPALKTAESTTLASIDVNYVSVCSFEDSVQLTDCDNEIHSIGECLINKATGFKRIMLRQGMSRQDISRTIFEYSNSNREYFDRLHNLSLFLNMYQVPDNATTIPLQECIDVASWSKDEKLLDKLPSHPTIGFATHQSLANRIVKKITPEMALYKYRQTKFGTTQFIRSFIGIGYIADHNNISQGVPITSAAFGGLSTDEFFRTSYGTRKGITDKEKVTPKAGYLARSLNMNLSPIEISEMDCGVKYGFEIYVKDKKHAHSLVRRYYKRVQNEPEWRLIRSGSDAERLIGNDIVLRSPILCKTKNMRVCRKCFGEYNRIPSKYVGVLTGQYISERITQLSMRTFHTSGSSNYTFSNELLKFIEEHLVDIENDSAKFKLFFGIPVPNKIIKELVGSFADKKDYELYVKIRDNAKTLEFSNISTFENHDVTKVLNTVNGNLNNFNRADFSVLERSYNQQIHNLLGLGNIYSTFIELTMCNSYIADDQILRYYVDVNNRIPKRMKRLNVKNLHSLTGSILSLLYVPNETSILNIAKNRLGNPANENSIYENIWLGKL